MPARLRIKVRNTLTYLQIIKSYWEAKREEILLRAKEEGLLILREEVPKRTGRLERSCWAELSKNTVLLGTAVPYDQYVDGEGRTAASPGRYVPYIGKKGKRLKRVSKRNPRLGIHPGSRKTPYSKRTTERLRTRIEEYLFDAMRNQP